jgi:hypothetical protein
MAKKRDILSNYFKDYKSYKFSYKTRLNELERDFDYEKNHFDELIKEVESSFVNKENQLSAKYLSFEQLHYERKKIILQDYQDRFSNLKDELDSHNLETSRKIEQENDLYQEILNQFEERKQEALDKYLQLTHDSNRAIDESMKVHHDFLAEQNENLHNQREYYNDINNSLANELLQTMEKAKNSLNTLESSLERTNINDSNELNQTVLKSIEHLRGTQNSITALFKTTSSNLEKQRDNIKLISRNKQKPHSQINQEMIHEYVQQIREINQSKVEFQAKVKQDLDISLRRLYPLIIRAHDEDNLQDLEKYILQKEIIENKAKYLLHRNQTLADFSISKYQAEIKKIKIDSFKRSEEIKLAYSLPLTFMYNSINIYSNFAFYLNQGFDELDQLLSNLITFNQEYVNIKFDFINSTSKAYEDYKINLIVRINEITQNLTKLINKIDDTSFKIITLESSNRLEIAEIRKKMDNLEILGDYQKYLASLENDEFFAMYQHNKNIERIQIESQYKTNLLNINYEVLDLNQNKNLMNEHKDYMLDLNSEEKIIHELNYDKLLAEFDIFYNQQIKLSDLMNEMVKLKIIDNVKTKNYQYAFGFFKTQAEEKQKESISSKNVIDYVHYMQKLIDKNNQATLVIEDYLDKSNKQYSYLTLIEKNRNEIHQQINDQTDKKISVCYQAASLYHQETNQIISQVNQLLEKYLTSLKQMLVYNETTSKYQTLDVLNYNGYSDEFSSLIEYLYHIASDYAYKYQIPIEIANLENYYEKTLASFNILVSKIFSRLNKPRKTKIYYVNLQKYFIESINLLRKYQENLVNSLENIKNKVSNNDLLFVAKVKIQADYNHKIIDKEYDILANKAIKIANKRKKQINHLQDNSQKLNDVFKKQVKLINDDFLASVKDSKQLLSYLESKFTKTVMRNDRELLGILKLIKKDMIDERLKLDRQYKRYTKTLSNLKNNISATYDGEAKYINNLYQNREVDLNKTINILEEKINVLPTTRDNALKSITEQKQELVSVKKTELIRQYSEIERSKFVSRPELLEDIKKIEKRLPEDYLKLYQEIQQLQKDYYKQYTLINEEYLESYQNYVDQQLSNKEILTNHAQLFKPFSMLNDYHENLLNASKSNYKETLQKSLVTREIIKEDKDKSQEKQNRIINT